MSERRHEIPWRCRSMFGRHRWPKWTDEWRTATLIKSGKQITVLTQFRVCPDCGLRQEREV